GSHGMAGLARQWLPLLVVVGSVAVLGATVVADWSTLSSLGGRDFMAELGRLESSGAAGVVMWPFRAIVRLPLAASPAAFASALPWALLILALNYVWVTRLDARFEEASAELAEKMARLRKGEQRPAARRLKAATPAPFTLSLEGRPEMAILWKNLISVGRYASLRTLLQLLPLFILIPMLSRSRGPGGSALEFLFFAVCVITIIMGPQIA